MSKTPETSRGWRYKLGFWMFTIPFVMVVGTPVVVPLLVPMTSFTPTWI